MLSIGYYGEAFVSSMLHLWLCNETTIFILVLDAILSWVHGASGAYSPLPTLDTILAELLDEDTCQKMINTFITHVMSSVTALTTGIMNSTNVRTFTTPLLKTSSSTSSTSSRFISEGRAWKTFSISIVGYMDMWSEIAWRGSIVSNTYLLI